MAATCGTANSVERSTTRSWAAACKDIWRPSDLLAAFRQVGFDPSLSKVSALWSGKPGLVRLDDLDKNLRRARLHGR